VALAGIHTTPLVILICGGQGVIGTVRVQLLGQLSSVTLSVRVKEPDAPAVTVTESPEVEPTIVPEPVIVQLCVTVPPEGVTVEVKVFPVELQFTGLGPVMLQIGFGLTVSTAEQLLWQPFASVTVTV
jgi:hypothetical protein